MGRKALLEPKQTVTTRLEESLVKALKRKHPGRRIEHILEELAMADVKYISKNC
jgi:hypothetical protein